MKELTAADVMNPQVLAVRPEMTVHELSSFLTENQITGAPVLDRQGRLVGVVSETDIAEAERYERSDRRPLGPVFDRRGGSMIRARRERDCQLHAQRPSVR